MASSGGKLADVVARSVIGFILIEAVLTFCFESPFKRQQREVDASIEQFKKEDEQRRSL